MLNREKRLFVWRGVVPIKIYACVQGPLSHMKLLGECNTMSTYLCLSTLTKIKSAVQVHHDQVGLT